MNRLRYIAASVLLILTVVLYFTGDDTDHQERTVLSVADSINAAKAAKE